MSMYTLLRNNTMPTEEEMEKAFEGINKYTYITTNITVAIGNLCRCTGYRPILDGYRTFCCKGNNGSCACIKDNCTGIIEVRLKG